MRAALAIALSAVVLLGGSTQATETEAQGIAEIVDTAIAAAENKDVDASVDAQFELYAVSTDESVSPVCRMFADFALFAVTVGETQLYFPKLASIEYLQPSILDGVETAYNNCLIGL